jgi:exodeoxyribonuclease-5
MLDTLHSETPSLSNQAYRELYEQVREDYQDLSSKKELKEALKKDPFLNALQVKFAYALTCHKSQGGQWQAVFVDQGYLTDEMVNTEYLRWLYTAITRASDQLFLVNFNNRFF